MQLYMYVHCFLKNKYKNLLCIIQNNVEKGKDL